MDTYILDENNEPVPCDDLIEWGKWMETGNRVVAKTELPRFGCKMSTVFLGLDHSFGEGKPLLFETMIFGGEYDNRMSRTSSIKAALMSHMAFIAIVTGGAAEFLEEENRPATH